MATSFVKKKNNHSKFRSNCVLFGTTFQDWQIADGKCKRAPLIPAIFSNFLFDICLKS